MANTHEKVEVDYSLELGVIAEKLEAIGDILTAFLIVDPKGDSKYAGLASLLCSSLASLADEIRQCSDHCPE